MKTRQFIQLLIRRGFLPLHAIQVALDYEEIGDVVPD